AVGEYLLDVAADVAAHLFAGFEEGIVGRSGAVGVEAEDDAGEVCGVGLRAAELIIGLAGAEGAVGEILKLPAAALIADLDIKFSIVAEGDLAGVVVAAHGLARIGLERAEHDDVLVECERLLGRIPEVTIDAVAQNGDVGDVAADGSGLALRPVEV